MSLAKCSSDVADDVVTRLTQDIRDFGRLPKAVRGKDEASARERNLASRLRKARQAGRLSADHEAELASMGQASQPAQEAATRQKARDVATELTLEIRAFGRLPQEVRGEDAAQSTETTLAQRLHKTRAAGRLTADHETELASVMERQLGALTEANDPPDPLDPFADEAENRLEQDLLMMANGISPKALLRRLQRRKKYFSEQLLSEKPIVLKYNEQA